MYSYKSATWTPRVSFPHWATEHCHNCMQARNSSKAPPVRSGIPCLRMLGFCFGFHFSFRIWSRAHYVIGMWSLTAGWHFWAMTSASAASSSTYQWCSTHLVEAEIKQVGAKADAKQQLMIKEQKLNSLALYLLISFSVLVFKCQCFLYK